MTKDEKKMAAETHNKELALVVISGLSWPTHSRKYLIEMVREAVIIAGAKSVIVAGHTINGKHIEAEHKARLKEHLDSLSPRPKGEDLEWEKQQFEKDFIAEQAALLADFFPVLPKNVNWHIAVAEKIYDRPLGAQILEKLRDMRDDVRIIGARQEDGYYDREPKIPIQFPGFEEIRVIMPHHSPWFSHTISNLVQRLHNAFAPRTLSPKPSLIITGVTGTAVHLPYYDGVPTVSVPDLSKLVEQQATEHMIGATVIRLVTNGKNGVRIINGVHNFRTAVFLEKRVAVAAFLPSVERAVMHALVPSDASFKSLFYRANKLDSRKRFSRKSRFSEVEIKKVLEKLVGEKKIIFSEKSNRYAINEQLRREANITLQSLWEGSRAIKHVVWSCLHTGALKSLSFSFLRDIPLLADDADACIENGDLTQGIAHAYEYNGELLPVANGSDKHELIAAHERATVLLAIFRNRLSRVAEAARKNPAATIRKCVILYVYREGNHDAWKYYTKQTLILQLYDERLRSLMADGILRIAEELRVPISYSEVKAIVHEKIVRAGESRMVELDGILVGIKHPYKSRTIQKSTRIQQVVEFMWRRFDGYMHSVAKMTKSFAVVYVANFHEAAAAHITKFGHTVLGVMTGAYLKDTEFESNQDKVVDHGPAVVTARFDTEGRLLYSETEFVNRIDDCDMAFVTADRIDSADVLQRCIKLLDRIGLKLPWR